ncbi:MAG: OmpA family protein [bacterium]|nr:OmpA family protein [bacterium]
MSTDNEKMWELTFSDMLTLLLTFFVFIISVSAFKTGDYKRFWDAREEGEKQPTTSFNFQLIKGLKKPRLNNRAETLLTELESTFTQSDFQGVDVNYTENKITLMISERISFVGGQSDLKEELKAMLSEFVPALIKANFDVEVEGHTDSQASEKIDNMELSLSRALTVARLLVADGLDKHKITVSGYGPYRPVADNKTPEGRGINRRVELHLKINND